VLSAFSAKDYGADAGHLAPTLRAMTHSGSRANGGGRSPCASRRDRPASGSMPRWDRPVRRTGNAAGRQLGDAANDIAAVDAGGVRRDCKASRMGTRSFLFGISPPRTARATGPLATLLRRLCFSGSDGAFRRWTQYDAVMPERIELRSVRALLPCARNSRRIRTRQVAQVAASIREFRVDEPHPGRRRGHDHRRHARLLAAEAGLEEVPVIVLAHLTPAQRRALVIATTSLR